MRRLRFLPLLPLLVLGGLVVVAPPASATTPTWSTTQLGYADRQRNEVEVADVDGDGALDVVGVSEYGAGIIRLGNGDGTFTDGPDFSVASDLGLSLELADFDLDGDVDIAYGGIDVYVLWNDGTGDFSSSSPGLTGTSCCLTNWQGLAAADVDEDGWVDLVATAASLDVVVLLNDRAGHFDRHTLDTDGGWDVVVADLDGDGHQDLVRSGNLQNFGGPFGGYYSYLGDGSGGFSLVGWVPEVDATHATVGVEVGDLDGDGTPDLVTSDSSDIVVHLGNGDGTFGPPTTAGTFIGSPEDVSLVDLDGDGDLDVAGTPNYGSDYRAYVLVNDGSAHFSDATYLPSPFTQPNTSAAADFDGDCRPDLVLGAYGGTSDVVLRNTTTPFSPCLATGVTATATSATTASVAFVAAPANGSAITTYTVSARVAPELLDLDDLGPVVATATGTGSPITVSGLQPSTRYWFTVRATNAVGTGPESALSPRIRTLAAPAVAPPVVVDPPTTTTVVLPTTTTTTVPAALHPTVKPAAPTRDGAVTIGDDGTKGTTKAKGPTVVLSDGTASWSVDPKGKVTTTGTAEHEGDARTRPLRAPVDDIAVTPSTKGYWLLAEDGGVFAYGDARFYGSLAGRTADKVVDLVPTASGKGYLLVDEKGRVSAFGDARDLGDRAGRPLAAPVVGLTQTTSGNGYWLLGADGGVFTYGDARFHGAQVPKGERAVQLVPTPSGRGYWIVTDTGAVHPFGDAT